jgi:hypothetical protein
MNHPDIKTKYPIDYKISVQKRDDILTDVATSRDKIDVIATRHCVAPSTVKKLMEANGYSTRGRV